MCTRASTRAETHCKAGIPTAAKATTAPSATTGLKSHPFKAKTYSQSHKSTAKTNGKEKAGSSDSPDTTCFTGLSFDCGRIKLQEEVPYSLLNRLPACDLLGIRKRHFHAHPLMPPEDHQSDRIARVVRIEHVRQVLRHRNLLAIGADDQIPSEHDWSIALPGLLRAATQAGAFRGAPRQHAIDQNAVIRRQTELLRDIRADGQCNDVERRPANMAVLR